MERKTKILKMGVLREEIAITESGNKNPSSIHLFYLLRKRKSSLRKKLKNRAKTKRKRNRKGNSEDQN